MRWTAGLLVGSLSVACSGDRDPPPAPDAGEPPGEGLVTVQVVDDGSAVEGAPVVFHRPDGSVAASVRADARGFAEHPIVPGSLVTVAYPGEITLAASRLQLLTYADVDPGDRLEIEIPSYGAYSSPDPGPISGSLEIELPPLEGAGSYVIHLGCVSYRTEELSTVVDVPASCLGSDDRVDVTVDAYTPPDLPARLATTFIRGVQVPTDVTADVTLPAWITTAPAIQVELTDAPAGATEAVATPVMLADGLAFEPVFSDTTELSGESVTLAPGFFSEFAERMNLELRVHAGAGDLTVQHLLRAPVEPTTTMSGSALLPTVREVAVDAEASELTWTASGDLSGADAAFLHLRSERSEGAIRRLRRWTVVAPPTSASPFELPALPSELSAYRPEPEDDYLDPGVVVLDVDWIAGFDAFVADHGTRFLDDACVPGHSIARLTRSGVFYGPRFY